MDEKVKCEICSDKKNLEKYMDVYLCESCAYDSGMKNP